MTDRDQLGRSDEKKASALLATSDCCCGVGDASSSGPPDGKSHLVWRRYCVLALAISTLSVLLCAVTWSQNASTHRRLLLVEERLKASLTIDDPQLDVKLQALLDNKLMLFPGSSPGDAGSGSSQARSRTIRQAASAPVDCLCPPGNSSPSYHRLIQHRFFFFHFWNNPPLFYLPQTPLDKIFSDVRIKDSSTFFSTPFCYYVVLLCIPPPFIPSRPSHLHRHRLSPCD